MNNVYFACADCRVLIDAGYLWAYWQLDHAGTWFQAALPANPGCVEGAALRESFSHRRHY
jgi:hypothetical protein